MSNLAVERILKLLTVRQIASLSLAYARKFRLVIVITYTADVANSSTQRSLKWATSRASAVTLSGCVLWMTYIRIGGGDFRTSEV
jgi:hypothetical protein